MSKAARAFSHNNSERFAGRNPFPAKSRKPPEPRPVELYNPTVWSNYDQFTEKPQLIPLDWFMPPGYEDYSQTFAYQIVEAFGDFYLDQIKPWLDENDITKVRFLNVRKKISSNGITRLMTIRGEIQPPIMENPDSTVWVETPWEHEFISVGVKFKDPQHYLMFKLRF